MMTTEFKSVSDPYSLRKNMLANSNNYVEELLNDLLEEGHLEHGEIYVSPQKKQPLPTPIQRPPQTANKKKSKKFERKTCMKCKKPEYDHVLWAMGREGDYDVCHCKGGLYPQEKKTPSPPMTDSDSPPSLVAFTTTTDSTAPSSLKMTPPLPSYASIAKKAITPPKEKTPIPSIAITLTLTAEERCIVLNDRIATLLQQHRKAAQTLEQQFHHLTETSVTGKLLAKSFTKTITDAIETHTAPQLATPPPENCPTEFTPSHTHAPFLYQRTAKICNQCKKPGHYKRDCQKFICGFCYKPAPRHIPSHCKNYTCNYCKQPAPGHFYQECPKRTEDMKPWRKDYTDGDYWN